MILEHRKTLTKSKKSCQWKWHEKEGKREVLTPGNAADGWKSKTENGHPC